MVRWRYCLVLAVLLLLPTSLGSKDDDDDDDVNVKSVGRRGLSDDVDEDDDDDDDDDEEEQPPQEKTPALEHVPGRRAPGQHIVPPTPKILPLTRSVKKRPLECYVCAFKSETPLRACLDPSKFRVHTITCHSSDDKCFTSVISKGTTYEAVVRGCRSNCVGSPETTCCETNRCNNQAYALPPIQPRQLAESKAETLLPPNALVFVTILLLLQTVVKVSFV